MPTAAKASLVLRALLEVPAGHYFSVEQLLASTGLPVRSLCATLHSLAAMGVVEFAFLGRGGSRLAKDRWYRVTPRGRETVLELLGSDSPGERPGVG